MKVHFRAGVLGAIGLTVVACLAGCGDGSMIDTAATPTSTQVASATRSPKTGWVVVYQGQGNSPSVYKRCDGTTLMYVAYGYHSGGISVVANSPECQ